MIQNYFTVEREGKCIDKMLLRGEDGAIGFESVMNMSYDEIKAYDKIDIFVTAMMDATNEYFKEEDQPTIVILVDENDLFIWGIFIGPGDDSDELKYAFIDWRKDGKHYRYEKD